MLNRLGHNIDYAGAWHLLVFGIHFIYAHPHHLTVPDMEDAKPIPMSPRQTGTFS
jgi:hypothetical protein